MYYKSETRLYVGNANESGEEAKEGKSSSQYIPTPKEFHKHLDRFVIGQENAKMDLSSAVHYHYKRITNNTRIKAIQESQGQGIRQPEPVEVRINK